MFVYIYNVPLLIDRKVFQFKPVKLYTENCLWSGHCITHQGIVTPDFWTTVRYKNYGISSMELIFSILIGRWLQWCGLPLSLLQQLVTNFVSMGVLDLYVVDLLCDCVVFSIGENIKLLIDRPDGVYCFRLHKDRVYYVRSPVLCSAC